MAVEMDREHENKRGLGWLWFLLAVVILALVVWWLWPAAEVTEPVPDAPAIAQETEPLPVPEPVPAISTQRIPIDAILLSSATYVGQTLSGEVRVVEVPTDRGFWIEDNGQRMFVILNDQPVERPVHIQQDTTIRLDEAIVRDVSALSSLGGAPLDDDTKRIARDQQVFLTVDEANVEQVSTPDTTQTS